MHSALAGSADELAAEQLAGLAPTTSCSLSTGRRFPRFSTTPAGARGCCASRASAARSSRAGVSPAEARARRARAAEAAAGSRSRSATARRRGMIQRRTSASASRARGPPGGERGRLRHRAVPLPRAAARARRWNYRRTAKLIRYSFFKNIALVFVLAYYQADSGFSGTTLNPVYAGFNFFLGVVPFLMGLVDRDVSARCRQSSPRSTCRGA